MKASELIRELQALIEAHGDLEVFTGGSQDESLIETHAAEYDEPGGFLFSAYCDKQTMKEAKEKGFFTVT
jgi:hypothetical protein